MILNLFLKSEKKKKTKNLRVTNKNGKNKYFTVV